MMPGAFSPDMCTRSDFCCIVDHALSERDAGLGPLTARLGLSGPDLAALRDRWLPGTDLPDLGCAAPAAPPDQTAITRLIQMRAQRVSREAFWLAQILARRSLEPRHLWEDLGLPSRAALSALIERHLPGLHAANRANMRWKKFFYRQICSEEGIALCLSPTCDDCDEWAECFAPE